MDSTLVDTSHLQPDEKFYVCMIAVDESTPENGCPAIAPGHHLHGLYNHASNPHRFDDKRAPTEEAEWLPCPLQRGDVLIYDNYMPHKSAKNESAIWRRALFGVCKWPRIHHFCHYIILNVVDNVDNSLEKGDFRSKYYELGRKSKEEGGTGRWATVVENTTGVGAKMIVAGADGTGKAVFQTTRDAKL